MKWVIIYPRGNLATIIFVLTVLFLTPEALPAEEASSQKPNIQKPDTFKELLKEMEIVPNKPGAQYNYLFKLEVPVVLKNVHPSVNKAAIYCMVSKSNPSGPDSWGQGLTEIPLQDGAYDGIINVYVTELARTFYKPDLIDKYECALIFDIEGMEVPFVVVGNPSAQNQIESAHKFGTLFQVHVEGWF